MTYAFTRRFLPTYGDRTVDQMVQAARSGKQNIVEGSADGMTSMEMELKPFYTFSIIYNRVEKVECV